MIDTPDPMSTIPLTGIGLASGAAKDTTSDARAAMGYHINHARIPRATHAYQRESHHIRDGVLEKQPKRDRKPQQKSELDQRLRSTCTKLNGGNVKAVIRMAVGDDKIADFSIDNYAALKLNHPQRETCSVPDPTDTDCFSTSEFFVHKALMSFPKRL